MELNHIVDGGDNLQCTVATNILNKWLRTAVKGWSSCTGLGGKIAAFTKCYPALTLLLSPVADRRSSGSGATECVLLFFAVSANANCDGERGYRDREVLKMIPGLNKITISTKDYVHKSHILCSSSS
jgi:hypothetical protein